MPEFTLNLLHKKTARRLPPYELRSISRGNYPIFTKHAIARSYVKLGIIINIYKNNLVMHVLLRKGRNYDYIHGPISKMAEPKEALAVQYRKCYNEALIKD